MANSVEVVNGDKLAQGIVKINQTPSRPLPGKYNMTIRVEDAGLQSQTNFTFLLDLVIVPTDVYTKRVDWCTSYDSQNNCDQGDSFDSRIVVIEITTSTVSAQNGFYIFDIGNEPNAFDTWANGNTGIITIDRTNAAQSTSGGNIPSDIPAYGGPGAGSYQNAFDIINARNFSNDAALCCTQTPDISENVFEIV